MSRLAVTLLLICLHMESVYGLIDCNYGSDKSFFDNLLTTCPRPTESRDKTFCCRDFSTAYCCTAEEFARMTGTNIIIPVIIGVAIFIGITVCCISCLCCSCCPWYRRRQGTVYGKVQAPAVQVIQPQSNIPSVYPSQSAQSNIPSVYPSQPAQSYVPPYPMGSAGMPQPPPYTSEAYAKQAPYNPAYAP